MSHPWSDSDDEPRHTWSSDSEQSSSDANSEVSGEQSPASLFIDFLVEMLLCRSITAKAFCVLMYYAGLCGVQGSADLGKRSNLPSGHYKRHLRKN